MFLYCIRNNNDIILMDLVIRALFICEFAYLHFKNWFKMPNSQSKCVFSFASSVFAVQNNGVYLPRITRPTCISKYREPYYKCTFQRIKVLVFKIPVQPSQFLADCSRWDNQIMVLRRIWNWWNKSRDINYSQVVLQRLCVLFT